MNRLTSAFSSAVPPWMLAVVAMLMIQLSNALSTGIIAEIGAAGTAWLRLCFASVFFLVFARPSLKSIRRSDLPSLLALGVTTGVMMVSFLFAIERIHLGTAIAIEFLGPLTVAAIRSKHARMLIWPVLALIGAVLLTEPWKGEIDLAGVGFAVVAGTAWGVYILLTQKVGDRFSGVTGLSITIPIAAVVTTFVGLPQSWGHLNGQILLIVAGLALLAPTIPFMLEMLALKRMTHTAFGTLMALEPAFGVVIGLIILHQVPTWMQIIGIVLVVSAGAAAQRGGLRTADDATGLT